MSVCRQCQFKLMGAQKRGYSSGSARDYNAAVAALNGLQSNFSIVEAIRKSGPGSNKRSIPDMVNWTRRIGYEVCDV
jgi:folylpolyglutamate synthase